MKAMFILPSYFARAAIPSVLSTITMIITVAAISSTDTADTVGS